MSFLNFQILCNHLYLSVFEKWTLYPVRYSRSSLKDDRIQRNSVVVWPIQAQRASKPGFGSTKFFEITILECAKLLAYLKLTIGNGRTCSDSRRRHTKYGKSVETPFFARFENEKILSKMTLQVKWRLFLFVYMSLPYGVK